MPTKTLISASPTLTAQTISATIIVNIVEPGTLGITITADGGSTPDDWRDEAREWLSDCLQARDRFSTLREPARRLAQATDDLSAALAGVSSAGLPLTRKRDSMTATDDLAVLETQIERATTEMEGATAYVMTVPDLIAAAEAQALANGATAAQIAPFTVLGTTLRARADALTAAIAANTPSEP